MSKKTKKLIVNGLTVSRIIGACFLPLVFDVDKIFLLIVFLIALFVTDFLDGKLSRYWKVKTIGGRLLDPLGDKMLALSCIFVLFREYHYLIALLVLEFGIIILNAIRTIRGEVVQVSFIGKVKTWLLSIALILAAVNLLNPSLINDIFGAIGMKTESLYISRDLVFSATMSAIGAEVVTLVCYLKESFDKKERKNTVKTEFKSFKEIFKRLFDEEMFEEDSDRPLIDIIKK